MSALSARIAGPQQPAPRDGMFILPAALCGRKSSSPLNSAVARPSAAKDTQPDPYVDYGRFLTDEGGILLIYKDIDERLRHTLWRIVAWVVASGGAGWFSLTMLFIARGCPLPCDLPSPSSTG